MDANKLEKLKDIKYEVHRCCGNCEHGNFQGTKEWGLCGGHSYVHLKHSDSSRALSVNKYGCCFAHRYTGGFLDRANHFSEFLE